MGTFIFYHYFLKLMFKNEKGELPPQKIFVKCKPLVIHLAQIRTFHIEDFEHLIKYHRLLIACQSHKSIGFGTFFVSRFHVWKCFEMGLKKIPS